MSRPSSRAKYAGRMDRDILNAVLNAVAASLGRKFVHAHVGEGVHTAANGLPLGAEVTGHAGRRPGLPVMELDLKATQGHAVQYRLVGVPLYMLWNLPDILSGEMEKQTFTAQKS